MPHSNETSTAALSRPGSGLSLSVLGLLFLINFFIAHGCIDGINWNENENTQFAYFWECERVFIGVISSSE